MDNQRSASPPPSGPPQSPGPLRPAPSQPAHAQPHHVQPPPRPQPQPPVGSGGGGQPRIQPSPPPARFGEERPLPVTGQDAGGTGGASAGGGAGGPAKITAFGKEKRHEDEWKRTPNTTGAGAIHVKTFHCKLTEDALIFMDQTINEWLDAHPQYEVKFVSSSIGTFTGKLKEPALICQVWV